MSGGVAEAGAVGGDLALLRAALDDGRLKLGIHVRRMNVPGSPAYRAREALPWPAGILAASFAATSLVHYGLGALVLALGMAWWLWKVQPRMQAAVYDRTAALVLRDEAAFDGLWGKGVLSLYHDPGDGTARGAHRRDDWRRFVRGLPPPAAA